MLEKGLQWDLFIGFTGFRPVEAQRGRRKDWSIEYLFLKLPPRASAPVHWPEELMWPYQAPGNREVQSHLYLAEPETSW
jgi:hypothetical protein